MTKTGWLAWRSVVAGIAGLLAVNAAAAEELRIYNWSDYIDEQILKDFTAATGIKVVYDVYDSNDILETKLLAGRTGYDLVVPSNSFFARQQKAGVFQALDKAAIPNLANLDPTLMGKMAAFDPDNAHAIIYMWGTTGFAYNVDKIKERMADAPTGSLKMLFDPAVVAKFQDCGVYFLDQADDMLPLALSYLGLNPDSKDPKELQQAGEVLKAVRPYVRKFHSSENINALATGDICLAAIWSGDAGIARARAEEAGNGVVIQYAIPEEGALLWFDLMAIPSDAPNPAAANTFINYLLQPEVIAKASNFVTYPNAVPASKPFIDPAVTGDPAVWPGEAVIAKASVLTPNDAKLQRLVTRLWTSVTTGR
ncbi:MAG: polyamine ABC transporter substrate-binding protein [Geminicoccaceae bacterium]